MVAEATHPNPPEPASEPEEPINASDAAIYIYDFCRDLAAMARQARFTTVAHLLDQARAAAAEALVEVRRGE